MKPEEVEPSQNAGRQLLDRPDTARTKALTRLAFMIIRQVRSCAFVKHTSDFDDIKVLSDSTVLVEYDEDGNVKTEKTMKKHSVSGRMGPIILAGGTVLYYLFR